MRRPPTGRLLLVFAKSPRPGKVKTRLAEALGRREATRIYATMGREVVDRVRYGPYRTVVCFDPPEDEAAIREWLGEDGLEFLPQVAGDLGTRLTAAFAWGFGQSEHVCAIGTDIPALERTQVEEAFRSLASRDGPSVVFGPAADGGYYLVALARLEPAIFDAVSWSTGRVLDQSISRARETGFEVHLLETLADVDRPEDVPEKLRGPS